MCFKLYYFCVINFIYLRRLLFIEHCVQMGLHLGPDQLDALCRGDMSGIFIHPIMIHIAHLWGCAMSHKDRTSVCPDEAHFLQDALASPLDPLVSCPLTFIQSRTLISLYLFFKRELNSGWSFLFRAISIVKFDGSSSSPLAIGNAGSSSIFGYTFEESSSVLYELVYIDHTGQLTLGLPPCLDVRMAAELREKIVGLIYFCFNMAVTFQSIGSGRTGSSESYYGPCFQCHTLV
jgi:hypothetical protein